MALHTDLPMEMALSMSLSPEGEDYIKVAEAPKGKPYLTAYDDGTGTMTIGWGCTHGVKKGMKITVEQAQAMFDKEIADVIADVRRVIKVPVSQGLADAFISFVFNNGVGKCQTLVAAINSGNEAKVRQAFMLYVNAYDAKKRKKVVWPGLVNRRTSELAHWAKMDAKVSEISEDAWAPAVEPDKPSHVKVAVQSKSVWLHLQTAWVLILGWMTNWGQQAFDWAMSLFGIIPDVVADSSRTLNSLDMAAGWFKLNLPSLSIGMVLACLSIALIRHVIDKRKLA